MYHMHEAGEQVLRPFVLRRTKAEVERELPDKEERVLRCALSAWQALWYRQAAQQASPAAALESSSCNTASQWVQVTSAGISVLCLTSA